jgi:hypothetical protein
MSADLVPTDVVSTHTAAVDGLDYEPTLGELLAERASAMSLGSLFAQAAGGTALTVAFAWLQPTHWPILICASIASAMHGVWGYSVMRTSAFDDNDESALAARYTLSRSVSSVVGITAAFAFLVSILFTMLGRWIS